MKTIAAVVLAMIATASCQPVYADDFFKGVVVGTVIGAVIGHQIDHRESDYYTRGRSYDNRYDREYRSDTHDLHERVEESQDHFHSRSKHD